MTGKELRDIYDGIGHELAFWTRFVQGHQFATWTNSEIVTPELDSGFVEFMVSRGLTDKKVLDVGSGAVSVLNGLFNKDNITTVDPLGKMYECIFNYAAKGFKPPIALPAEAIDYNGVFDVVHMRNALDHSQSPFLVLNNLIKACKLGGYIIVQGFENEAIAENYQGFHKWNITILENGELHISGNAGLDAGSLPGDLGCVWKKKLKNGKSWFVWICRKI